MEVLTNKRQGASLGRMYQHVKGAGFGIITSWRQDFSVKKNLALFKQLKSVVRSAGFGFVELDGYWEDEEATEAGHEPSLFIPAVQKRAAAVPQEVVSDFEDWMLILARKYNQDAFVMGDGERVFLIDQRGKRIDLGTFSADRISQAWSKIKKGPHRGRSFIFATVAAPGSKIEAVKRQAEGEIWSVRALQALVTDRDTSSANYPPKAPELIERLAKQEIVLQEVKKAAPLKIKILDQNKHLTVKDKTVIRYMIENDLMAAFGGKGKNKVIYEFVEVKGDKYKVKMTTEERSTLLNRMETINYHVWIQVR